MIDSETAVRASLALQHRPTFLAGLRDDDPPHPDPAEACSEIGADDPEDIRRGMQALAGAIVGFVASVAVVGFVLLCVGVLS